MPAVGSMGEGIAAIRRGSGQGESFGKTALSQEAVQPSAAAGKAKSRSAPAEKGLHAGKAPSAIDPGPGKTETSSPSGRSIIRLEGRIPARPLWGRTPPAAILFPTRTWEIDSYSSGFAAYANDRVPMLIAIAVTDRMAAANDLPAHSRGRPDTKQFAASPSFPIRRAAS